MLNVVTLRVTRLPGHPLFSTSRLTLDAQDLAVYESGQNWSGGGSKLDPSGGAAGDSVPQDSPALIRQQLEYLRKRDGFSHLRLAGLDALKRILGGVDEPSEVLRSRLVSAISSLRDADAELLLAAFRLSDDAAHLRTVGERRDRLGQRLGVGREAVADREQGAIDRLLTQLITGWYPQSPIPMPAAEPHGGIVHFSVGTRVFLNDLHFAGSWHHHRYLATFDGAEYIQIDTSTEEEVETEDDYTLEEVTIRGGRRLRFRPPEPLKRGVAYDLRYRTLARADDPLIVEGNYLAFHEPTRRATFEAVFRGMRPDWIWWFSGLTSLAVPGEPHRQRLLRPRPDGLVSVRFTDLYGGLFSGLAWE